MIPRMVFQNSQAYQKEPITESVLRPQTYAINSRKYTLLSPHPPHLVFSAVSLSPNLIFGEKNRGKEWYKHAGAPEAHKLWLLVLNLIIIFQHAFI